MRQLERGAKHIVLFDDETGYYYFDFMHAEGTIYQDMRRSGPFDSREALDARIRLAYELGDDY